MPKHNPHISFTRLGDLPALRTVLYGVAVGLVVCSSSEIVFAQAAKAPMAVVKTDTLTTADGWTIPITYYQSTLGKGASVVLLLHGEGNNQLVWKDKTGLAKRLHAENFAVVTCDLRKHGEAKNTRSEGDKKMEALDYKAMASASNASELETIREFLFKEHQLGRLNMAKLGILAADNMVPVALNWAANDWIKKPHQDAPTLAAMTPRGQTVRAIAMLSPAETAPGISSTQPLKFFRNLNGMPVSFLFMNGDKDGSTRDMKNMEKQVKGPKNEAAVFSESFPTTLKGADLLGRIPKADALVVGFFKKQLQDIKVEWRDRKSKAL